MPRSEPPRAAAAELLGEITRWPIFDPHTHIDPRRPAARHFDEILGYHYYTELAHSAGMPALKVDPSLNPSTRATHLAGYLDRIDSTIQYSWLIEIARTFHGFDHDRITPDNIGELLNRADKSATGPTWDREVWTKSGLETVFLTNDFDDPLEGWDTSVYVPCLRTDDLVLKLHAPGTVERLRKATGIDVQDRATLKAAVGRLFEHFTAHGARACAISLPADFRPRPETPVRGSTPLRRVIQGLATRDDERQEASQAVFWMIAEFCDEFGLPFDLMIGPARDVYPAGVAGGRDLFDRRVSLYDYRALFNHFANTTFVVSTLAPDAAAELVAYSWIFPNVLPMGHWWYSNIPAYIEGDLRARVQALPKVKILGYYSDAYKLEFIAPKFNMFRGALAGVLARELMGDRGWTMDQTLQFAKLVLLENPRRVFGVPRASASASI